MVLPIVLFNHFATGNALLCGRRFENTIASRACIISLALELLEKRIVISSLLVVGLESHKRMTVWSLSK